MLCGPVVAVLHVPLRAFDSVDAVVEDEGARTSLAGREVRAAEVEVDAEVGAAVSAVDVVEVGAEVGDGESWWAGVAGVESVLSASVVGVSPIASRRASSCGCTSSSVGGVRSAAMWSGRCRAAAAGRSLIEGFLVDLEPALVDWPSLRRRLSLSNSMPARTS